MGVGMMNGMQLDGYAQVKKIGTGISTLDDILYGGLPEGSQNVIMGQPGTGKSILAFHMAYANAKLGIPCTVILIDQRREDFIKNVVSAFPHLESLHDLIDKNMINISENPAYDKFTTKEEMMTFIAGIIKSAQSNNSKIVVIDELSILRALLSDDREFTRMMNYITENLHLINVTSIMTIELPSSGTRTKIPGLFEESMFDGVIRLANLVDGDETEHVCAIVRMRFSKFKSTSNAMKITPDGVIMSPLK